MTNTELFSLLRQNIGENKEYNFIVDCDLCFSYNMI